MVQILHRLKEVMPIIDWRTKHSWNFEPIDKNRFPSIELARRCGALGGSVTVMFNAANEVAVEAFLKKLISFTAIIKTVEKSSVYLQPLHEIEFETLVLSPQSRMMRDG